MTGSTSYELGRQQGMQEAQHRILELEQRLAGWPDLFDENMQLRTEIEQYRSIAEQVGASKAVSELEQATARIRELEQQLAEAIEYQIVLVNEKNQFRQQLEASNKREEFSRLEANEWDEHLSDLNTDLVLLREQNANYYKSYQLYMERALDAESRNAKLIEALEWALGYIDTIPSSTIANLPAMPGFDRDYVDDLIRRSTQGGER